MEIGALPLPLGILERALDPQTVDLLAPAQVAVEFSAREAAAGSAGQLRKLEEEVLLAAGEEVEEREPRPGAVWGYSKAVGEPVHLSMHVRIPHEPPKDLTMTHQLLDFPRTLSRVSVVSTV